MAGKKHVLFSIHDVSPFHLDRLRKAERWMLSRGVSKVNYLIVPDFHRKNREYSSEIRAEFQSWIDKKKPFTCDWLLHGYDHLEPRGDQTVSLSLIERIRKGIFTSGEGEFLSLTGEEIDRRLEAGIILFKKHLKHRPNVFVAPAWLFRSSLLEHLKKHGFTCFEDYSQIRLTDADIRAPVITWSTGSAFKRWTSYVGCPLLLRLYSGRELIRIAVHPYDFDHPLIMKSMDVIVKKAVAEREAILYRDLED